MFAFIVIPSKDRVGVQLDPETSGKVRELAVHTMVAMCGGATCYEGQGVWRRSSDGVLMHESVTRIEAWCGDRDPSTWLRELAEDIATAANQESVMYGTLQGRAMFTGG